LGKQDERNDKKFCSNTILPVLKDRRITMLKQSKIQNFTKTVLCIEIFYPNRECPVYKSSAVTVTILGSQEEYFLKA
jgi:hypothetical protein